MLESIFSLNTLWWIMFLLYVPACLGLIVIVLLQKGKGVGFAGAFGVGPGSETLFGPRSTRSFTQYITYGAAATFMVLALCLSTLSGKVTRGAAPELAEETTQSESLEALFEDNGDAASLPESAPAVTPVEVITPAEASPAAEAPAAAPAEAPAEAAAPAETAAPAAAPAEEAAAPAEDTPAQQ